jgi:hypothetical protein
MSTASKQEYDSARVKLDAVVARAKGDGSYMQQIKANPRGTLLAAGLPDGMIDDVLREENAGDVSGYMRCWFTCAITDHCSLTITTA